MFSKSIFKRRKKNLKAESKFDINSWMELTKEDRLEIDLKERNESMRRKKKLLKSIRDEYIKIKNKK